MQRELTAEEKISRVMSLRPIDDGLHEIFVNTVINDGSDIADLMSCFIKKEVNNPKFPYLSERVTEIKSTEGGISSMSAVIEKYFAKELAEGRAEGRAEGKAEGRLEGELRQLVELVKEDLLSVSNAAKKAGMSEDRFVMLLNVDFDNESELSSFLADK